VIPKRIEEKLRRWSPRFSQGLFKAVLIATAAAAFIIPLALLAVPYLEIFNDMAVQPKGRSQSLYGTLQGRALFVERKPAAGTIPMGYFPYHLEGNDEKTQKIAEETVKNPIKPTMKTLELGRKLFNQYCITCHGEEGHGDGPIIGPDLFPAPPSLHTDTAKKFKDGRIFHNISRGQNTMPSYADKLTVEERWAVVLYVRALQRALNPKPEDLEK